MVASVIVYSAQKDQLNSLWHRTLANNRGVPESQIQKIRVNYPVGERMEDDIGHMASGLSGETFLW